MTASEQNAVRETREAAFRLLVSRVRDYAIFMLDPSGRIVTWNEGAERIKCYSAADVVGRHMSIFYTTEDRERDLPKQLLSLAELEGRVENEGWRVRKDGTRFWADVVITALRDDSGQLRGFAKVTRDLTERREAELALADLSGRLLEGQDEERRSLSRHLHDTTSPLLAGLLTKLYAARRRAAGDEELSRLVEECLANAEGVSTALRTVSALLHPPLLDEVGLLPSLRWYLEATARRTGMQVDVALPDTMARLSRESEMALFRIAQEALTTLAKHSGSTRVRVELSSARGMVALRVVVHGSLSEKDLKPRGDVGVAVAGMRERMRQRGGTFDIETQAADRISITATVPYED